MRAIAAPTAGIADAPHDVPRRIPVPASIVTMMVLIESSYFCTPRPGPHCTGLGFSHQGKSAQTDALCARKVNRKGHRGGLTLRLTTVQPGAAVAPALCMPEKFSTRDRSRIHDRMDYEFFGWISCREPAGSYADVL